MKVAVLGIGHVGVPLAAMVAGSGARVVGIASDERAARAVAEGRMPLWSREPGLGRLLREQVRRGRLTATTDMAAARDADVVLVCEETGLEPTSHNPDNRTLKASLRALGPHLRRGSLVSIETTIAPGTMKGLVRPALEKASGLREERDFHLIHCPERLVSGRLLRSLTEHDRILGAESRTAARRGTAFYRRFVKGALHLTDWTTAEVAKTAESAYVDVQIAFANEIALLCEELGVDAFRVRELVNTAPSRAMLFPGAGVGGHRVPKDPWLLIAPAIHSKPELIPTARSVNDFMPTRLAQLVDEALVESGRRLKGARVAVLGFAYRENTEDVHGTAAKAVVRELRRRGADVTIHDPYARSERGYRVIRDLPEAARGADAVAIVTAHDAYRRMDLRALHRAMRRGVLVDGRGIFEGPEVREAGFVYRAIGRGQF